MHVDELPARYGRDQITLLVRDPEWLFAYWECGSAEAELVVYREPGTRTPVFQSAVPGTGSSYVRVPEAGAAYSACLIAESGHTLVSNTVRTPPGRVSDREDAAWAAVRELIAWDCETQSGATSPGAAARRTRLIEERGGFYGAAFTGGRRSNV